MSDQEQDAAIGRMVSKHGENKRKLVAMNAELDSYSKAFGSLSGGLNYNQADDFNLIAVEDLLRRNSILQQFDLSQLVSFLKEYTELRRSVDVGTKQLRDLGL